MCACASNLRKSQGRLFFTESQKGTQNGMHEEPRSRSCCVWTSNITQAKLGCAQEHSKHAVGCNKKKCKSSNNEHTKTQMAVFLLYLKVFFPGIDMLGSKWRRKPPPSVSGTSTNDMHAASSSASGAVFFASSISGLSMNLSCINSNVIDTGLSWRHFLEMTAKQARTQENESRIFIQWRTRLVAENVAFRVPQICTGVMICVWHKMI